eukprot:Tbor_TRINITY_DN5439_c3_g3::TRINITY_DN5439_c3_g3_i1::g.24362::m.24362/K20800/DPCD; protein DPCD
MLSTIEQFSLYIFDFILHYDYFPILPSFIREIKDLLIYYFKVTKYYTSVFITMPPALSEPSKSVISQGRRRILYKYVDGTEMIEEFDVITDELLLRKTRVAKTVLGGEGKWDVEVGQEATHFCPERDMLKETADQPILSRCDEKDKIVFKIRNLPYEKSVFSVTVDYSGSNLGEIVVRTSNKKYYKRIEIADMKRSGIALIADNLSYDHKYNTLTITYKKHLSMLAMEMQQSKERASMSSVRVKDGEGADTDNCKQQ